MEKLPVIFRRPRGKAAFANDGVTAVFPTLPQDTAGRLLTVYAHVGQHGGASFGWYTETRAAKPEEYADLLRELQGIYGKSHGEGDLAFELVPYRRMTAQHRKAFNAEVRRLGRAG